MAAAPKKKAQTEKKAKGLVGWKGGKPVKDAPNKVGDYKGKTINLTKKQLGKAGVAAAKKRTVDISKTKYEGKKVLGPAGKPLTGTVDLGGGNIAVYKNGVRVRAAAKKAAPKPSTRSGSTGSSGSGRTATPSQRGEGGGGSKQGMSAAQANKLGAEAPRGNYPFPKNKRGIWLTPKSNSRIEAIMEKNRSKNVRYGK